MRTNALAVANYLVNYAKEQDRPLKLLGLMKRVYIVHGFSMAIYGKFAIDSRFDIVEAWKYGPVIPSVYHSFKYNKDSPITELTDTIECVEDKIVFNTPLLEDVEIQKICKMVWNRYEKMSDSEMVELTHREGTPWDLCYIEGANAPIPDKFTELYYRKIIETTKAQQPA